MTCAKSVPINWHFMQCFAALCHVKELKFKDADVENKTV